MSQAIWSACALVSLLVGLTKVELVVLRQSNADASSAVPSRQDVGELVPGMPIERELAGGEAHSYQVTLASGEYLHVVVDQRGIDVVVTVFGPDGLPLATMNSAKTTRGQESISVVAEASGDYRLEVRAFSKEPAAGRYEIKIEELRVATPEDTSRVTAQRLFIEAEQLRAKGAAESLREANERGQPQDGFLRLHEVYNLNLAAELVVLSGCKTGLGKEIKGEGLVGLTRGFMYAGAARVVVSLWSVSDVGTAELMKRFYEGMSKKGLRPAAALRAAQVSMWKEKRWEAPYYWAGFVFQGEWK